MPDSPQLSKNQRREAAREAARLKREKEARRAKLMKWLVPTGVSLGLVAVAAIVGVVIWSSIPKPSFPAGPENMASDGILFEGQDGALVPVETAGVAEGDAPTPTAADGDVPAIVTYVDWSCPICADFEARYGEQIEELVAAGDATLEVHPVSILDRLFQGTRYSSRSANVASCVAEDAPESFLDVQRVFFENQPEENGPGLEDDEMLALLAEAGVEDDAVISCVEDEDWEEWVTASTERATSDDELKGPQGFGTPTTLVNGERWDGTGDFLEFVESQRG